MKGLKYTLLLEINMSKIKIVYVDDYPETELSKFLYNEYNNGLEFESEDIKFDTSMSYDKLLHDELIKTANIIIIDSKLFEDKTAYDVKFSGEEFKILINKYFPFIEVIVITQNKLNDELGVKASVPKWQSLCGEPSDEFYSRELAPVVNSAISSIKVNRKLIEKLNANPSWDRVLVEKIINSLEGKYKYDELTKADIDELITAFQDLHKGY